MARSNQVILIKSLSEIRATIDGYGRNENSIRGKNNDGWPPRIEESKGYMAHEKKQKSPKYWNDFSRVEEALLLFIASHGTPGIMPTRGDLKAADQGDLAAAIDRHGSFEAVAERLRLHYPVQKKRPNGYWKELTNLVRELRAVAAALGMPEVMPTQTQLLATGHSSLVRAIHFHGHFEEIARTAGLRFTLNTKPSGYWNDEQGVRH